MKRSWRRFLPVFLSGVLLGAAAGSWCQRRVFRQRMRGPDPERILKRLTRELDLDSRQREEVKAAIEARKAGFESLRKESAEKFAQLRSEFRSDVAKILHPRQLEKFSAMNARHDRKHGQDPVSPLK